MSKTEIVAEPGVPQVIVSRAFRAPRELLFRAYTDPRLLVRWLGPRGVTMAVDRLDARDGGAWRYIHYDADGNPHAFRGFYHGTPSPDGIVQTYEYENAPGHVFLNTLTFDECDGITVLRQNSVFQSVDDRDDYVKSGMDKGVEDSMARLDELVTGPLAAE